MKFSKFYYVSSLFLKKREQKQKKDSNPQCIQENQKY